MGNENCLQDKRCPKCGYEDEIVVYASMWVSLCDDGTDPFADSTKNCGGVDYDEHCDARCPQCGHEGKLQEWEAEAADDGIGVQNIQAPDGLYVIIGSKITDERKA